MLYLPPRPAGPSLLPLFCLLVATLPVLLLTAFTTFPQSNRATLTMSRNRRRRGIQSLPPSQTRTNSLFFAFPFPPFLSQVRDSGRELRYRWGPFNFVSFLAVAVSFNRRATYFSRCASSVRGNSKLRRQCGGLAACPLPPPLAHPLHLRNFCVCLTDLDEREP